LEHKLRSDLNGALNILKKATNSVISTVKKPLSFTVDHNRVAPVSGVTPKTSGNLALRGGEEVRVCLRVKAVCRWYAP